MWKQEEEEGKAEEKEGRGGKTKREEGGGRQRRKKYRRNKVCFGISMEAWLTASMVVTDYVVIDLWPMAFLRVVQKHLVIRVK